MALRIDALRGRGLRSMRAQRRVLRSGVGAAVRQAWPAIYREVWEERCLCSRQGLEAGKALRRMGER